MLLKALQLTFYGAVLLLLAEGCKVTRTYTPPGVPVEGLYRDSSGSDTNTLANLKWSEIFTDTILQGLIREAASQNIDLNIAFARMQQADAYYSQSKAAFLPTLVATGQVTEAKLSAVQGFGIRRSATQFQLGVSSSWETNLWGRLSSAKRAAYAAVLESEAYSRAVQTALVANVAGYYYALLSMDRQLAITQRTVQYWDTTVTTMKALKEAAVVTGAAVVQSEAQRYAAEVTIPDIRQNIREAENALSVLLARPPGPIRRSSIEEQLPLAALQTGVPAQLLANRPDVQQAELSYRRFFEQTNMARAAFYPGLTITGSGGISSLTLGKFFDIGSVFGSIAAGITQPIFNQRLNRTNLQVATAQQQEAFLTFKNTLLTAGQEVSNALSLYQAAIDKMRVRTNQLSALQKSVEYSQELLRYGSANYTEVIQARQSLLLAELSRVNDRLQQLQAGVDLYRALGGGWK